MDIDGHSIYARYYPGSVQIAIVANNPDEQDVRTLKLGQRQGDKLRATYEFAEDYVQAIQNGSGLQGLVERYRQEYDPIHAAGPVVEGIKVSV